GSALRIAFSRYALSEKAGRSEKRQGIRDNHKNLAAFKTHSRLAH
ncbi:hypothetical protein HMPREF1579_00782, partial [Gardnerella vaginalis JCP8066]